MKYEHLHESFFIRHKSKVVGFSPNSEIIGKLNFEKFQNSCFEPKLVIFEEFFDISISRAGAGPISGKNSSIFGLVFQKSVRVMRHESCPKIHRLTIGSFFHLIGLAHAPEIDQ